MTQRDRLIITACVLGGLGGFFGFMFVCVLLADAPWWVNVPWYTVATAALTYGLTFIPPISGGWAGPK